MADALFGRLAGGTGDVTLARPAAPLDPADELFQTKRPVGALQGGLRNGYAVAFVTRLHESARSTRDPLPRWVTVDLVRRAAERVRRIEGRWRATPFGEAMTLRFRGDATGGVADG